MKLTLTIDLDETQLITLISKAKELGINISDVVPSIPEIKDSEQSEIITEPKGKGVKTETSNSRINAGMEVIDISDSFYNQTDLVLDPGKHYKGGLIRSQMISDRTVKIRSSDPDNRPILEFGMKEYRPLVHGKQDGHLFMMLDKGNLLVQNVDICQDAQIPTVETFNPRMFISAQMPDAKWTAVIQNCDTTRLGNNGGFGAGLVYGGTKENHFALLNFKHFGTGLMDAKNPYQDGVLYVTLRDVDTYAYEDAKLSKTDFEQVGSLKNGVLTFDGSIFCLTSGYNWEWTDNDAYLVLWDRYTFILDGYKANTVLSDNQFRIRPQAQGECQVGVFDPYTIYSNEVEMHVGDQFIYQGTSFTIVEKDRSQYPWFDSRTTEAIAVPGRGRSIFYTLDKELRLPKSSKVYGRNYLVFQDGHVIRDSFEQVVDHYARLKRVTQQSLDKEQLFQQALDESYTVFDPITIEYKGEKIEFSDQKITLIYKGNGGFATTNQSKYRDSAMLNSRGIGHLCYNHSDISMDAANVKHRGFYRGSEKGQGKSLIWNLYNCEGFDGSGVWFNPALPVTHEPNLPLNNRILELLAL